jgi:hypothetical protein
VTPAWVATWRAAATTMLHCFGLLNAPRVPAATMPSAAPSLTCYGPSYPPAVAVPGGDVTTDKLHYCSLFRSGLVCSVLTPNDMPLLPAWARSIVSRHCMDSAVSCKVSWHLWVPSVPAR